jgi:hypothetical protein
MDRGDRYHAPLPPELTTPEYARDWHEVYAVGGRQTRESALKSFESQMALLWSGGQGTSQETGFWLEIARSVVEENEKDRRLSLTQQAQVMTSVAVANGDAMISSWNSKWTYTYWRPRAAIHRGDEDGNPATFSYPKWERYCNTHHRDILTVRLAEAPLHVLYAQR